MSLKLCRCPVKCPGSCPKTCGWEIIEDKSHCNPIRPKNECCFPKTFISVKNTTSELIIPTLEPILAITGNTVDLVDWTDIIVDIANLFDNASGTYEAPEAGDYHVELIINYEFSVPISTNPDLSDIPFVDIYDVDFPNASILASTMSAITSIIVIPPFVSGDPPIEVTFSSMITRSQVVIAAIIPLVAGQRIRARAVSNGLIYIPPFSTFARVDPPLPARVIFNPSNVNSTFTIFKVRNTPVLSYC